jgi:NarL family two-component system response regulator LiaR
MEPHSPIRIIIVDDHAMTRTGLRFFLAAYADLELVGEAGSGEEAVTLCRQHQPDVVLMDMVMPGMDGAQAIQHIRQACPRTRILVLTSFEHDDMVQHAIQAGAIGYLLKNISAQPLAEAIRAAHAGRSTLAEEIAGTMMDLARHPTTPGPNLTPREREVLALLVEGLSNAQIAQQLTISLPTVKYHVRHILTKLGASSRTEAVSMAWQHGLLP